MASTKHVPLKTGSESTLVPWSPVLSERGSLITTFGETPWTWPAEWSRVEKLTKSRFVNIPATRRRTTILLISCENMELRNPLLSGPLVWNQVTKEVHDILSHHGYRFEERGEIHVKGKSNPILTYFLIGRPPHFPDVQYRTFDKCEEMKMY